MKRQHTLLILLAASALAQAKDCASDDSVLNEAFAALNSEDEATVATANDKIRQLLRKAAAGDNWDCDYPQAQEQGLSVQTSDDRKFRAYSWDDHNGGTARYYLGLWQYRDGSGKTHIINANWSKGDEEGGNSGSVTDLYTAQLDGNGTVYLLEESEKGSSRDYGRSIRLLRIKGDKLEAAPLIHTKKEDLAEIFFAYDRFSLPDDDLQPVKITYDDATKTLRVPLIKETDEYPSGQVTEKKLTYRYDGKRFTYQGEQ